MKDLSDALRARIKLGVTTLCTCLSITRRDGAAFFFTDHDEVVDTGGMPHQPVNSFSRTSVQTSSELEVDSLEIRGILNSDGVTREDVASGLFDFAEVSVYVVDYENPALGRISLRTGWLGEVVMNEDYTFEAEARGLTQVLTYRIGEPYAPECRANLGDSRCKVPLIPRRWQATTSYREGDAVLGVINGASNYAALSFENGSFEDDAGQEPRTAPTDWATKGDADGRWGFTSSADGVSGPKTGSVFAYHTNRAGGTSTVGRITQTLDLNGQAIDLEGIDTGLCRLVAGVWAVCLSNVATVRLEVAAVSASGGSLVIFNSGGRKFGEDRWSRIEAANVLIPAGTRKLTFLLETSKKRDHTYGGGFDAINAAINYPDGTYGSADQFGDVCFVARTAGVSGASEPAFSSLIGDETLDGTVRWKTVKAWAKVDTARAAAADNRSFVPNAVTDPEGYYDGGLISWETGRNAGRTQEVKTWKGGRITLFQRPYYLIRPGDRFVLRPGCDKRRITCFEKFGNVVNMRAEPDVPGQDEYYKTPNASSAE